MNDGILLAIGVVLFLGNAFFVAAEYALVGVRKSGIEAQAKKGGRAANLLLAALNDQSKYVAGIQTAITFLGIAIGALLEPALSRIIKGLIGPVLPAGVVSVISIVAVSYPLVVIGELVPKYVTLRYTEPIAYAVIRPLMGFMVLLRPFTWLFQVTANLVLRLFRINVTHEEGAISREELALLVQAGETSGEFDESQADVITKALRLDKLDANDIMIHRLDMKWLDSRTPKEELLARLGEIPHSRIPICAGDIDDLQGIVYVSDILRRWNDPEFSLEMVRRPAEFVPENLTLDRMLERMRATKTQILIVQDEYGGTSGLVTLEDVIEEVFGDLEDTLESERPPLEWASSTRVTARADVRYDELLDFLEIEPEDDGPGTETLATIIVDRLGRTPKIGDAVELPIGKARVEQLSRHRIIRVGVILSKVRPNPAV